MGCNITYKQIFGTLDYYSWDLLQRIPRYRTNLLLLVPYYQLSNKHIISCRIENFIPYRQVCLISVCAIARFNCISCFSAQSSHVFSSLQTKSTLWFFFFFVHGYGYWGLTLSWWSQIFREIIVSTPSLNEQVSILEGQLNSQSRWFHRSRPHVQA